MCALSRVVRVVDPTAGPLARVWVYRRTPKLPPKEARCPRSSPNRRPSTAHRSRAGGGPLGMVLRSRLVTALASPHGVDRYLERFNPMWAAHDVRARIVSVHRETDGVAPVATLTLQPTSTWRGHRAGQHVLVGVEIARQRQAVHTGVLDLLGRVRQGRAVHPHDPCPRRGPGVVVPGPRRRSPARSSTSARRRASSPSSRVPRPRRSAGCCSSPAARASRPRCRWSAPSCVTATTVTPAAR